ncbi:hypothetical protein NMY22_g2664 [Coprinellus aureogranulatus]|nr:hypothetical protein NMY22_g2664 [Coprinellus aureogranulatus]
MGPCPSVNHYSQHDPDALPTAYPIGVILSDTDIQQRIDAHGTAVWAHYLHIVQENASLGEKERSGQAASNMRSRTQKRNREKILQVLETSKNLVTEIYISIAGSLYLANKVDIPYKAFKVFLEKYEEDPIISTILLDTLHHIPHPGQQPVSWKAVADAERQQEIKLLVLDPAVNAAADWFSQTVFDMAKDTGNVLTKRHLYRDLAHHQPVLGTTLPALGMHGAWGTYLHAIGLEAELNAARMEPTTMEFDYEFPHAIKGQEMLVDINLKGENSEYTFHHLGHGGVLQTAGLCLSRLTLDCPMAMAQFLKKRNPWCNQDPAFYFASVICLALSLFFMNIENELKKQGAGDIPALFLPIMVRTANGYVAVLTRPTAPDAWKDDVIWLCDFVLLRGTQIYYHLTQPGAKRVLDDFAIIPWPWAALAVNAPPSGAGGMLRTCDDGYLNRLFGPGSEVNRILLDMDNWPSENEIAGQLALKLSQTLAAKNTPKTPAISYSSMAYSPPPRIATAEDLARHSAKEAGKRRNLLIRNSLGHGQETQRASTLMKRGLDPGYTYSQGVSYATNQYSHQDLARLGSHYASGSGSSEPRPSKRARDSGPN